MSHPVSPICQKLILFLSSEADEVMSTIDPGKVYVIGGLVDHNRHKGLTHRRATERGIRTLRLPIDEHLRMSQVCSHPQLTPPPAPPS